MARKLDEAEAKAKKMYGKIEDKIEDDTRKILGQSLSAALNAPILPTQFGLFRM